MAKKCLIIYASRTKNTENVAIRIQKTFEKHGWKCDSFNVEQGVDIKNPPFNFDDYEFICAGSAVIWALPTEKIVNVMRIHSRRTAYKKIVPGPKCGIVFCTYGGAHLGPKEAEAALKLLELEIEHLEFKCIGSYACPGKYVNHPTPEWYHGDIRNRPNEDDLKRVSKFIEEKIQSEEVLALA
jgi:flavodoxin